jgi:hypothetical protein
MLILGVCLATASVRLLPGRAASEPGPDLSQRDPPTDAGREQPIDVSIPPLLDERALLEECRSAERRLSQIEGAWSATSPSIGDDWEPMILELHRRLDDLGERIDQGRP